MRLYGRLLIELLAWYHSFGLKSFLVVESICGLYFYALVHSIMLLIESLVACY